MSQVQKSGKLSNGWTDWHQIWHTSASASGNGYSPNKLPLETQGGHLGGFMGQWTHVEHIGPMRHQGDHFDAGLSMGNVLGFKGVNISSKVWGMPRSPEKTN